MQTQITIIDFYNRASSILEKYRTEKLSYKTALSELNILNNLAEEAGLEVFVPTSYLQDIEIFDDEMSYEQIDEEISYESSYDD